MEVRIREIKEKDRHEVVDMMRFFYSTDAVSTNGSEEIFENNVDGCLSTSPFLTGYVFESDVGLLGYAMTAHSFSTEFGKPCVWIEDLYIKEDFRGRGIGGKFFAFIEEKHKGSLLRLEVEDYNTSAVALYKKCGFTTLPYMEMKK